MANAWAWMRSPVSSLHTCTGWHTHTHTCLTNSGVSNVAGHMLEPIWHEDAGLGDLELRAKKNYGEFVKVH
eukprot:1159747-Pelagomonas_calceolata.AAC.5